MPSVVKAMRRVDKSFLSSNKAFLIFTFAKQWHAKKRQNTHSFVRDVLRRLGRTVGIDCTIFIMPSPFCQAVIGVKRKSFSVFMYSTTMVALDRSSDTTRRRNKHDIKLYGLVYVCLPSLCSSFPRLLFFISLSQILRWFFLSSCCPFVRFLCKKTVIDKKGLLGTTFSGFWSHSADERLKRPAMQGSEKKQYSAITTKGTIFHLLFS